MMMITSKKIIESLDLMYPDARCELNYNKDYELLIATVLSAQTTDKQVNRVTDVLFNKYDIFSLAKANLTDIEKIIKPAGTFKKKAIYIQEIAHRLVNDYNGIVPNNRKYLESLPGVGRKVCNVVISNLFDTPAFAVDTHVQRVAKRLKITGMDDDVMKTENKLMDFFPKNKWKDLHHQMVLFGRYICKAKSPLCESCLLREMCEYKKNN